jgi:hypothetical protein
MIIGPGWNVKLALSTKNVKRVKESLPYFKKNFFAKQFMLGLKGTVPKWYIVLTFFNNISKITTTLFLEDINEFESELKANNIILTKDTKIGLTAGASTERAELEELKEMLADYIGDYNERKN